MINGMGVQGGGMGRRKESSDANRDNLSFPNAFPSILGLAQSVHNHKHSSFVEGLGQKMYNYGKDVVQQLYQTFYLIMSRAFLQHKYYQYVLIGLIIATVELLLLESVASWTVQVESVPPPPAPAIRDNPVTRWPE
jgi:hypothetical protein